jgi:hypothetical protein
MLRIMVQSWMFVQFFLKVLHGQSMVGHRGS